MMNNPKVSIIVPCYNQAHFLDEALQSVLDQTFENWECIIVNDGSPDNTEDVAEKWVAKDNRFLYLYKKNGGLSSARNAGITIAKGEYILLLDADDIYEKSFLEKGVLVLNNDFSIGVVSSWGIRFDKRRQYGLFKPSGGGLNVFLFHSAATGTSLIRKKCWADAGKYDENMRKGFEDWEFYIRVSTNNWGFYIIQEVLFFYRQHEVSMRRDAIFNYDVEANNKKYMFSKHSDLYIAHYDEMIDYFLHIIADEKKNKDKIYAKIDFRLGAFILKPLRFLRRILKSKFCYR